MSPPTLKEIYESGLQATKRLLNHSDSNVVVDILIIRKALISLKALLDEADKSQSPVHVVVLNGHDESGNWKGYRVRDSQSEIELGWYADDKELERALIRNNWININQSGDKP